MRTLAGNASVLVLTISVTSQAAIGEWPSTTAGTMAKGWVTAFKGGDAPMRQFLVSNLANGKRVEERMKSYRKLRRKVKTLSLVRIDDTSR